MTLSEGLIPLSAGLDAMVMDYFECPKAYGSKLRTAVTKGKAKAKIVNPTPAEPSNSLQTYSAHDFFQGDIQREGIVQYKGRKGGKKGEGEVNDAFLVIKTSGQGVTTSNINGVYQGLSNINTFLVCLACSLIPRGYPCHFLPGSKNCTCCEKHHLKCSNSLSVEELELMFQQLLPLFSGSMPALADNFALLESFLSKAA
ncbi:hypothetical protein Moror_3531 [Moniliophthora roreri MCA 2997]|uniref:Uncharacterized protein n=1 Tax=Moniliophthora roreri (strain MCA 2997) TaxID=1381753 RepID=V2WLG5_MONRO|nr:hypothetical protein Moror_3531 [Moniliophthora roreri MCA 2997]